MSYKRIIVGYVVILALLFFCILRVSSIALTPQYLETAKEMTSKKILLSNDRGTIYDSNHNKLTNNIEKYALVITDNPKAIKTISEYFSGEETVKITNEIRNNKFATRVTDKPIDSEGLVCLPFNSRIDKDSIAKHIIGYLDEKNIGVSGLELAFNDILFTNNQTSITVGIDGQGGVLLGSVKLLEGPKADGVVTTIDSDIQKIVEEAANKLTCGAVVVVDSSNGKIKALTSRPDFDPENLGEYISDTKAPLINRALLNYNVGSIFKPCVAAAALESGYNHFSYNCTGATDVDGLLFHCHNRYGHGQIGLSDAIKYSCNTYFYNYAINLGAAKIFSMAEKAGFNSSIFLSDELSTSKGNIGDLDAITTSKRALANLAIGQGELMLSPVAITNLYCAIANNGVYYPPTIYEGKIINDKFIKNEEKSVPVKLMKESTAQILKNHLRGVLDDEGTGHLANPKTITAAGKTATAQTGVYKDGKYVTNTWFCGFFPFENPRYVVTVLAENTETSCAGIFAEIADKMYSY